MRLSLRSQSRTARYELMNPLPIGAAYGDENGQSTREFRKHAYRSNDLALTRTPPIGDEHPDWWARLLGGFVTFFAVWTLYCHALVYAAADYDLLLKMSWVPLVISAALIHYLPTLRSFILATSQPNSHAKSIALPREIWLAGAVVIVAVYAMGDNYLAFWLLAVGYLIGVIHFSAPLVLKKGPSSATQSVGWSNTVVGTLIICAMFITLVSHRPDIDDAFYLNLAVSAIDHPDWPLLRFDGMYGEQGLPLLAYFYRVSSYELLVATVSSFTQMPAPAVYYILAPTIMAAFVVIAHWLALRELSGKWAMTGLVVTLIALVTWGDVHRSYGNFSFVRLFQGKAALVSICVPALVYYASRYARRRDGYSWGCMALTQIAAIGFSSTALVVAPAAAALFLIGSWRPNAADTKMLGFGLAASFYAFATIIFLAQGMEDTSNLASTGQTVTTAKGLTTVLGEGGRAYLALFALLAAPLLATSPTRHRMLAGTVLATVVLALNPLTAGLIAKSVSNMSWRIFWSVPFPLWVGLTGAGIAAYGTGLRAWKSGMAAGMALAITFTFVPGKWTVSAQNHTRLAPPGYKVAPAYGIAKEVVEVTPQDGTVLAPWSVSTWIPTFRRHPPLVAVRPHYLSIIRASHGEKEAEMRNLMARFVSGGRITNRQRRRILEEIEVRGIATVVLFKGRPFEPQVARRLQGMGFNRRTADRYDIWVQ